MARVSRALAAEGVAVLRFDFTGLGESEGWPLDEVEVRLRHEKIHCEDCGDPERPSARIDHFRREIVLEGPLDGTQRDRLLKIADRCPVHRTLEKPAEITTTLAERP